MTLQLLEMRGSAQNTKTMRALGLNLCLLADVPYQGRQQEEEVKLRVNEGADVLMPPA